MSGARHRQKGNRAEREIVDLHKGITFTPNVTLCPAPAGFGAAGMTSISIHLVARPLHSSPRSRRERTARVLFNWRNGSPSSTPCFCAGTTPTRLCCCRGACGSHCSRKFPVEAQHECAARDEPPGFPGANCIFGGSQAPSASGRTGCFRRRARALDQRFRNGDRKGSGRHGDAPPARARN